MAALAACQAPPGEQADLVLQNANVVTMDRNAPEAEAIAVAGDRILAVGTDAAIRRYIGSETKVIDLEGTTVIPGMIDSHVHFIGLGNRESSPTSSCCRKTSWPSQLKRS